MPNRADDRLQYRIQNKLDNVGLRAPCRIRVEVYEGAVTLKGTVLYEYQMRAAMMACRSMDGVRSFTNLLEVKPPDPVHTDPTPGH